MTSSCFVLTYRIQYSGIPATVYSTRFSSRSRRTEDAETSKVSTAVVGCSLR